MHQPVGLMLGRPRVRCVQEEGFPHRGFSTLETIARHLAPLREDPELTGHVLPSNGRHKPLVVDRTNNLLEQFFGITKKGLRRKVGTKSVKRFVQAMRPEVLLVANLNDPLYLDFVCGGNLARLPACFSEHWPLARTIRQERQQPKRDHPLPTSKKAIRHPNIFDNLKELVGTMIRLTAEQPAA